jgi:E3 ubiquitin-protein ligase MYCBP2
MDHPELQSLLNPIYELYEEVKRKALTRLQYEGLEKSDQIINSASPYYNNPEQFAMDRYCYYSCFKCKRVSY